MIGNALLSDLFGEWELLQWCTVVVFVYIVQKKVFTVSLWAHCMMIGNALLLSDLFGEWGFFNQLSQPNPQQTPQRHSARFSSRIHLPNTTTITSSSCSTTATVSFTSTTTATFTWCVDKLLNRMSPTPFINTTTSRCKKLVLKAAWVLACLQIVFEATSATG